MLRKKIFKILSVLVAVIIAFSCFMLPCSAATISGVTKFGDINLKTLTFYINFIQPSGYTATDNLSNDIKVEGFNGDGSLRLNCSFTGDRYPVLPANTPFRFRIAWNGDATGLYFVFPDYFIPDYSFYSDSFRWKKNCNGWDYLSYDFDHNIAFYGEECFQIHSNCYVELCFHSPISFSQFDVSLSFTDPRIVPPMEAMFNDLGSFFGSSSSWFLDIFSFITANSALFFVVVGFPLVAFVFAIPKFLKG